MGRLTDTLLDTKNRPQVVAGCVQIVEKQAAKAGFFVNTAYKAATKAKPDAAAKVIDRLLPDFAAIFDEQYQDYVAQACGKTFDEWIEPKATEVAGLMLEVTDELVEKSGKKTIKKTYGQLRKSAVKHVAAAVPGIAGLVADFAHGC
ncbi:MAG: hypothetical protein QMD09_12800 [Desulfatibacillaceae bacterium]|nr:hypothetical protein [Desulfatibacillaceae bacterium]